MPVAGTRGLRMCPGSSSAEHARPCRSDRLAGGLKRGQLDDRVVLVDQQGEPLDRQPRTARTELASAIFECSRASTTPWADTPPSASAATSSSKRLTLPPNPRHEQSIDAALERAFGPHQVRRLG